MAPRTRHGFTCFNGVTPGVTHGPMDLWSGTPDRCNPHSIDLRGPPGHRKTMKKLTINNNDFFWKDRERHGKTRGKHPDIKSELFRMGQAGSLSPHLPHPQRLQGGTRVFWANCNHHKRFGRRNRRHFASVKHPKLPLRLHPQTWGKSPHASGLQTPFSKSMSTIIKD